jgi:REP element-mobilizing transposase RayT
MADPIAYFLTWTTYGTWLPGDQRGWVKRGEWVAQAPDPELEKQALDLMTKDAVILTPDQRALVEAVIAEHCQIRKWLLHAKNVRTNHAHVVVTAPDDPKIIRRQLKAWSSRRLSGHAGLLGTSKHGLRRWWSEKGDIEWVRDEEHLAQVIKYVLEMQ